MFIVVQEILQCYTNGFTDKFIFLIKLVTLYLHFATSVVHEITTALGIYCFRWEYPVWIFCMSGVFAQCLPKNYSTNIRILTCSHIFNFVPNCICLFNHRITRKEAWFQLLRCFLSGMGFPCTLLPGFFFMFSVLLFSEFFLFNNLFVIIQLATEEWSSTFAEGFGYNIFLCNIHSSYDWISDSSSSLL